MSKYNKLWEYLKDSGKKVVKLTFPEIENIADVPIDHSFLKYKKEAAKYGYEVDKISMKNSEITFEKMKEIKSLVIYVHGKGGNAGEAECYKRLFDGYDVIGLDYKASTPWEAEREFPALFDAASNGYQSVVLIANSIGAYFSTCALSEKFIEKAFFISPIADMIKLITDMMKAANISEKELFERKEIVTDFGETLSWEYLQYAKTKKLKWDIPTYILYGENDDLTSKAAVSAFAKKYNASLTVMSGGEHWFHTEKQTTFLARWIKENITDKKDYIIRPERAEERREVESVVRESFYNVYRPGCLEHYVLHRLRDCSDFISELNYVLEKDGKIIGQNVFVKAEVKADDGRIIPVAAMGPICIAPEYKRQGYGKILLDYTLEKAKDFGVKAVLFEGDIAFYGKSGFSYARNFGIRYHGLPSGADDSFFLCKELEEGFFDGVTGEYSTPECYFVDENEAEEFDKNFPYKEKLKLPGQLFK